MTIATRRIPPVAAVLIIVAAVPVPAQRCEPINKLRVPAMGVCCVAE